MSIVFDKCGTSSTPRVAKLVEIRNELRAKNLHYTMSGPEPSTGPISPEFAPSVPTWHL